MLQEGLIILFNESAPEDLKSFCITTSDNELKGEVKTGDSLTIADYTYKVTAIGNLVNENLYSLGHVTLCFDGANEPQLPGHIHLTPNFQSDLTNPGKIIVK